MKKKKSMKATTLKASLKQKQEELVDPDGFDLAFFQGAEHILKSIGDGGLSEQYIAGILYVLGTLDEEEIGGTYETWEEEE